MVDFVRIMEPRTISYADYMRRLPELLETDQYFMYEEVDGVRQQILIDEDRKVKIGDAYGERSLLSKLLKNPTIIKELKNTFMENTLIEGVFFSPTADYKLYLAKHMITQHKDLSFIVTDIIFSNDEEVHLMDFIERYKILKNIFDSTEELECVSLLEPYMVNKSKIYYKINNEYEDVVGIYFKKNCPYHFGVSKKLIRYRKNILLNTVIMSITDGQGKYEDSIGSLVVGCMKDRQIKKIGYVDMMTMDQRDDFAKNKEKYIGKVIKVYSYKQNGDDLMSFNFIGFEQDKTINDCVFEEE